MLNNENYYQDKEYCSASQYKDFFGCLGKKGCEARALAKWKGDWKDEVTDALLIGSYVDSAFEGTLDKFKEEHKEIFTAKGELKAQYKLADLMIDRILRDSYFMRTMAGEHQKIVTGVIGGVKFKGKLDSYHKDLAIYDLKTCQSITKTDYVNKDYGRMNWIDVWGYDYQLAIYRELIRQETGKKLPCYISAVSKEKYPDIRVIQIEDYKLDNALADIIENAHRIDELKKGLAEPIRCEECDYCKSTRVLTGPIMVGDLYADS